MSTQTRNNNDFSTSLFIDLPFDNFEGKNIINSPTTLSQDHPMIVSNSTPPQPQQSHTSSSVSTHPMLTWFKLKQQSGD